MEKERKQDLSGPDEEALEEHVREMLDVTVPDLPTPPEIPEPKPAKPTKITISEPETPSAPELTPKKTSKKPVSIAVTHHEDEPVKEAADAPVDLELAAAIEEANKQLAGQQPETAPLVPVEPEAPKKSKKVVITHFDEPTEEISEPDAAAEETPLAEPEQPEPELTESTEPETETPEATEPEQAESPLEATIESAETDKAVAEIIASEGDELLVMKDEKADSTVAPQPKRSKAKKRSIFTLPFRSSGARWFTGFIVLAALVGVGITPSSRYAVLNAAGVRSSASVVVLDESTQQPLKNVTVKLSDKSAQTDATGKVQFDKLKLGPTQLVIEKPAFATTQRAETIGWGSNPLADVNLKPIGIQYTFLVTDVLSGKPLGSAEAVMGESSANADGKGEIKLTLDPKSDQKVKVHIKAAGYREEVLDLPGTASKAIQVALTPDHKVAFISKRTGTYNLYKIDADGKNEQLVLKGTGSEQDSIVLATHPTSDVAVMLSTRDNKHDTQGNLLASLTFVNLADGATKTVIQSPQIRAVDWIGTRFIYVQTVTGSTAEDPQRSKLMSFDYVSGDNRQLAAANYFNDVVSAAGKIYFAPASAFQNGVNNGMFMVHADGSGKQAIFDQEVWNIFRTGFDSLTLAVQQDWYSYVLGGSKPSKLSGQPSNTATRIYVDSPDGKRSIWIDVRDGKGTLVVYDTTSKQEKVLFAQNGLKGPIRWIGANTVAFRLVTDKDSADYVVSLDGGNPKELADVTDTKGIDRWVY